MKTETMEQDKSSRVKDLSAEIQVSKSKAANLKNDINATQGVVSQIDTFVRVATEIRQTGKQENKLALKDAQAAQTALTNAISVLEGFYKETGKVPKEPW